MKKSIKLNFTSFWEGFDAKNNYFLDILSQKYDINQSNSPDFLLYGNSGYDFLNHKCIRIHYSAECVKPNYFQCDFAFSHELSEGKNHRLPHYAVRCDTKKLVENTNLAKILADKQYFCAMLSSNAKAQERHGFFEVLQRYKPVHSGGRVLNNIGYNPQDKMAFIQKYKFNLCFENQKGIGYTTEKLCDAMLAGCIPIYWGNPLAFLDFNPKAFIQAADYKTFDKLLECIVEIDQNDEMYKNMLLEPKLNKNRLYHTASPEAVLEKFEYIFSKKDSFVPVAQSWKSGFLPTYCNQKLEKLGNKIQFLHTQLNQRQNQLY